MMLNELSPVSRSSLEGTCWAVAPANLQRCPSIYSEAEAGAREHCLGILESLDLCGACLLAQVEVLHDEIACSMQVCDDCCNLLQVCGSGRSCLLCSHEHVLCLCLRGGFSSQGLGITCASLLRISHELRIIFLSSLLLVLHVLHVASKITDDSVHHANNTSTLCVLLDRTRWHFRSWGRCAAPSLRCRTSP